MNARHCTALALATLPLFLASTPRGEVVAFKPEDGSRLSKELAIDLTFYLEDISVSQNGQELPPEMLGGAMDEGLVFKALIGVTDEYVKSARGRHLELLRTFDALSLEAGPESESESVDEFEKLEDTTVRFKWDEEEGEYARSFHESTGDEGLLEMLDPDMDFLGLLPEDEVETGDAWEVSGPRKLAAIFLPGGLLAAGPDDEKADEVLGMIREEIESQLSDAFENFAIRCTYKGARDEDGQEAGEIEFKFEGTGSLDLSDLLKELTDMQIEEAGGGDFSADVVAGLEIEVSGQGKLLWNLDSGRVFGFDMSSELMLTADVEADVEAMGQSMKMELSAEVSGEGKWKMTTSSGE